MEERLFVVRVDPSLCVRLRERGDLPILILTKSSEEAVAAAYLDTGLDSNHDQPLEFQHPGTFLAVPA